MRALRKVHTLAPARSVHVSIAWLQSTGLQYTGTRMSISGAHCNERRVRITNLVTRKDVSPQSGRSKTVSCESSRLAEAHPRCLRLHGGAVQHVDSAIA